MTPAERTEPRRASPGRTTAVAAVFAATLVAATVSWVQVVTHLRNVIPIETRGTPAAIVWSDRVFRSEAEFARWLRSRGISYERWVRTHPNAVAILRSRDRAAAPTKARPRNVQAATVPESQELSGTWAAVVVTALLTTTLAFVLALGATIRNARRSRRGANDAPA